MFVVFFFPEIATNLSGKADILWWISVKQKCRLCCWVLWNLALSPMSVHYISTNSFLMVAKSTKQNANSLQCFAVLAFSLCSAKYAQDVFVECVYRIFDLLTVWKFYYCWSLNHPRNLVQLTFLSGGRSPKCCLTFQTCSSFYRKYFPL